MTATERWLPIPGQEGRYDVSNEGRVRSWLTRDGEPRILKQTPTGRGGYLSVYTSPRRAKVHQMVLLAFVGPRPPGLVCRHLDDDRTNNTLANLAYGTYSENADDRVRNGRDTNSLKTHCPRNHEYTPETTHYSPRGQRSCLLCRPLFPSNQPQRMWAYNQARLARNRAARAQLKDAS